MRWPWSPPPGMVRVPAENLLELYQAEVRAMELEREIAENRCRAQRASAEIRALQLIDETGRSVTEAVTRAVRESLPVTAAGDLHEAAFLALVDAMTWDERDAQLRALTGGAKETKA